MAAQHDYSVEFVEIGRALQEQEVLAAMQQGSASAAGAAAAAAAEDAADAVLPALPSVTPAAGPSAAAAADAVTAAMVGSVLEGSSGVDTVGAAAVLDRVAHAGQQQEQQQAALVADVSAAGRQHDPAELSNQQHQQQDVVMQDPFQDPFQQASMGPDTLGGASQAAVFRLNTAASAALGSGPDGAGVVGAGSGRGLSVFWGPVSAVLRVGSFQGAAEAGEDSSVLAAAETEHF
jgi:hypothetical protein